MLRSVPVGQSLSPVEKAYAARIVQQRVHQPAFRAQVMLAYGGQCTVCSLKHPELLDAAHIIEDGKPGGDPVVTNGLSLCKIHHAGGCWASAPTTSYTSTRICWTRWMGRC